jgi:flagellar hook-associated protein 3 FlgL
MRVSTATFYEQSRATISAQQGSLLKVQTQLGTGSKILAPSDDPLGSTRALAISQAIALNAQYASSRAQATQTLTLEETTLQNVTSVLDNVRTSIVQAGNGTLSDSDRASIASVLQSNLSQLQGLGNADDGNGQFLFGGFKSGSPPFLSQSDGSIAYAGDQGQRLMQVDVSRQMSSTDDGRSIFQSVQSGAGYVSATPATNKGSAVFGTTAATDRSNADFGKDFVISFPTATTYRVDTVAVPPVPVTAETAFTDGQALSFGGLQVKVTGTPVAGDTISIKQAKNAGTDIFASIRDVIAALNAPTEGQGVSAQANLSNALATANRKVVNAADTVSTVRASVGSRLQELDALGVSGDSRTLASKSYLSSIQDLDYATAISEFYQRQTALQASQQTFVKIQNIALFNYL